MGMIELIFLAGVVLIVIGGGGLYLAQRKENKKVNERLERLNTERNEGYWER